MAERLVIRAAHVHERSALEALQRRASMVWPKYRAPLQAHPDAIAVDADWIAEGRVLVAEMAGGLAGFCVVLNDGRCGAELDGLFVEPSCMGRGVGRRLEAAATRAAGCAGAARLDVITGPETQAFYRRCGYRRVGVARTRFGPAIRMRKVVATNAGQDCSVRRTSSGKGE